MTAATEREQAFADAAAATAATSQAEQQPAESLRELAMQGAVLKLLAGRVKEAQAAVRKRTQAALDAAAERDGTERIAARLPGGEAVATIGLRRGETGPVVTDEEALARWLRQTWPEEQFTEARLVRTVRPWKLAELLGEMSAAGAARVVDKTTGEVHDVPGVVVKPTRARTHGITWRKGGEEATAEAWRTGALADQLAAIVAPAEVEAP